VDLAEGALEYDQIMGSLIYSDGQERERSAPGKGKGPRKREGNIFDEVIVALSLNPGLSGKGLAQLLGRRPDVVLSALRVLSQQSKVTQRGQGRNSGWWLPGVTIQEGDIDHEGV
jgi:hypothetical protein